MCVYVYVCVVRSKRSNLVKNLHYVFVHMLVCNKSILFNMHGMNIKVDCS